MPELRKDYVLERYVIIAADRGKRPHDTGLPNPPAPAGDCFFCPGKEEYTPQELWRLEEDGRWLIRVFPNRFPVVSDAGGQMKTDNLFYTHGQAGGRHEVMVETPEHGKQLADLSVEHLAKVIAAYGERIKAISALSGIRYVSVFKNEGTEAGCSIMHSHTQIVGYNMVPAVVAEKEAAARKHGACPYCGIIQREQDSERRIINNEQLVCFAPYASRFPYEAWILPRRHVQAMEELRPSEISAMAAALKAVLAKLRGLGASYNFYIHYGNFHLQLIITPRLARAKWAGFELSTETIINIVAPESAAAFYRG